MVASADLAGVNDFGTSKFAGQIAAGTQATS